MTRPRSLVVSLACAALLLAGCVRSDRLRVDVEIASMAPLRLGVPHAGDPAGTREAWLPLAGHLGRGLARPVEFVLAPTQRAASALLSQGKVDLAWLPGVAFARLTRGFPAVALARAVRGGRTTHAGELVVLAASAVRRVEDLKGCRLAYVAPDSGSGFLAANQLLLDAGLTPGGDLAATIFTYGHLGSLKALAAGACDAAAVFEGATGVHAGSFPPGTFRSIGRSRELPNDVVACARDLEAGQQERLRALLFGLARTGPGRAALDRLRTHGGVDHFASP